MVGRSLHLNFQSTFQFTELQLFAIAPKDLLQFCIFLFLLLILIHSGLIHFIAVRCVEDFASSHSQRFLDTHILALQRLT